MSPLEAARSVAKIPSLFEDGEGTKQRCRHCGEIIPYPFDRGHEPDCPWLAMPRIVAALEAAQDAVAVWESENDGMPDYGAMSHLRLVLKGV